MSPPVQAGPVCAACPGIQADLALVKGRQEMVMKNQEEMKGSLQDIYDLLRAQNGEVKATDKEVAVLKEDAKNAAVSASTVRAVWITAAGLFLREAVHKIFGF